MRRLVIIGTAYTLNIVPWDLKDVTYWACAPVITHPQHKGHRIDALFELHEDEYCIQNKDRFNEFVEKNPNCKIYMRHGFDTIKNSVAYPLVEVQSFANHPNLRTYFTSTIAYMAALGISCGQFDAIEYYGVHMASNEEEYSLQRSCLEAWVNFGLGKGIDYWFPPESDVMKSTYLYGFEQDKGFLLKAINFKKTLVNTEVESKNRLDRAREEYFIQQGARLGVEKFIEELRKKGTN